MSTNYQAVIAVGLPFEELEEKASDLFTAGIARIWTSEDECFMGIGVAFSGDFNYTEIELDALQLAIDEAKKEFYNLTGQHGKVYLSTEGF